VPKFGTASVKSVALGVDKEPSVKGRSDNKSVYDKKRILEAVENLSQGELEKIVKFLHIEGKIFI
jgi:hypothetical protein